MGSRGGRWCSGLGGRIVYVGGQWVGWVEG